MKSRLDPQENSKIYILPHSQESNNETEHTFPKDGLIGPDPKKNCCVLISGIPLENICPSFGSKVKLVSVLGQESTNCTCINFLYCRLVVVTAFSSNHFEEAQDLIASVQANLPYTRLIVYDLGLTVGNKTRLSKYCNVEIYPIDFSKYPPHAKHINKYAWKPIITSEISKQYEVVIYGDASLRILHPVLESIIPLLLDFPFVSGPMSGEPIPRLTHDSTLRYLGLEMSRKEAANELDMTLQAIYSAWFTEVIRENWLKRWLDCALHEECIAPTGTDPFNCNIDLLHRGGGEYIGCHRFDQSALNIILYQEFGRERWKHLVHDSDSTWIIERENKNRFKAKTFGC